MCKTRGFTLIEVMVVLSILAIITALTYSFFGSTMAEARKSQAVTAVARDLDAISIAWERYYNDFSDTPAGADAFARIQALAGAGYLRSVPVAPDHAQIAAPADRRYFMLDRLNGQYDIAGTTAKDTLVGLSSVDPEVCQAFNERLNTYSPGTPPPPIDYSAVPKGHGRICYQFASNSTYYILQVIAADTH